MVEESFPVLCQVSVSRTDGPATAKKTVLMVLTSRQACAVKDSAVQTSGAAMECLANVCPSPGSAIVIKTVWTGLTKLSARLLVYQRS